MNSSRPSDVSLYELATAAEPTSHPLQISPTTFKSLVGVVFDFLAEKNIPATLYLKLPKGEVWQAEVERFYQMAAVPYTLYSLQTYQESDRAQGARKRLSEPADLEGLDGGAEDAEEIEQDWGGLATTTQTQIDLQLLPLAPESQLKREYFLLVVSERFYGLVLAHRPRSMRAAKAEAYSDNNSNSRFILDDGLERKHPLLGLCSFHPNTLQQVLEGVNRTLAADPQGNNASISWEHLQAQGLAQSLDPLLLGELMMKQVQRQEELWRSSAEQRRRAEQAGTLQRDNETLLSALQTKDEFVKNLGQELRTPLSTMKTALSLLNSPNIKPPQRQRYMEMLSQQCDRQSSLITSVLDLVQIESMVEQLPMESLRVSDIVPGVVSTYQPLAQEKGVMLAYTVPEDLPPVACLGTWLKQIVINLLHNSIKFTPKGGQVWVRAKQQGDYIQLEFRDTGIGIASEDIPRIFERFYRARGAEESGGAGLGLSIVQQLLIRCGGSITVKSKVGEGSIFYVLLPAYQSELSRLGDRARVD